MVGVNLYICGIAFGVAGEIQYIPEGAMICLAHIAVLVEMPGISFVCQGVEQTAVAVPGRMVDVYDVGSRFVYGRGEIESGAQIILQRGIDVADVADLSAQRRKVV